MYLKVLEFHELKQDLDHDDFYQTASIKEIESDIIAYIQSRPVRFPVLAGCIGAGKTTLVNRVVKQLEESGDFLVAVMVHNDSSKITEPMITEKLLRLIGESPRKSFGGEIRYEILKDKIEKQHQRIILVIDDAQGLRSSTLISLKKASEKGISVMLAAHTRLATKMKRSMFEEVGLRTEIFELPGIIGEVRGYLEFLLEKSSGNMEQFSEEAIDELSRLCRTPRQVRKLAWAALRQGVINKEKQISLKTLHEVLPTDFSNLWVELQRLGYSAHEIAEEIMEDKRRVMQCLNGRLPEDDGLYQTVGVFLHGIGLKMAAGA